MARTGKGGRLTQEHCCCDNEDSGVKTRWAHSHGRVCSARSQGASWFPQRHLDERVARLPDALNRSYHWRTDADAFRFLNRIGAGEWDSVETFRAIIGADDDK